MFTFLIAKIYKKSSSIWLALLLILVVEPIFVVLPVGVQEARAASSLTCNIFQPIVTSSDDAQQAGTTMTLNGTTIGGSLDAITEWVGLRFQNIGIPQGATINSAYIKVVPSGTGEDEPLVTIYLEDADNPGTFTTDASNISNRSRTSGVEWSNTELSASGATYHDTPNLASILQTVVNRPGWASGNTMSVIIQGGATAARDLTIESIENTENNPPTLYVSYTANVSSCQAAVPITLGTDDAQQAGTTMTLNGTTIGGSLDAITEWVGLRFQNIGIPQGASISSAYIKVMPSGTGEDEPLVSVYLENADNPGTFTTDASNISNRSRTSGVEWSSTDLGATGSSYHNTPDITAQVQTILNRSGWASGNAMGVIIQGGATAARDLTLRAFEFAGNNQAYLFINYTLTPIATTSSASGVSNTAATLSANLIATGGQTGVGTQHGFAWGTNASLSGGDTATTTLGTYAGMGAFTDNLSSLSPNTTYYFRAYATNSDSTGYGSIQSFTTLDLPAVSTSAATNVASSTVTLNGNLAGTGNETGVGTQHGFAWGTNASLSGGDTATTTLGTYAGMGAFQFLLDSLTPGTTYYFRAYAANSVGTSTGTILSFLTDLPSVLTFRNADGENQIAFNNIRYNSTTPTFRVAVDTTNNTVTDIELELNTAANFSGTSYTQTFSGSFALATSYNLLANNLSPSLPTTDGATYFVRVRGSRDSGSTWDSWSTGTWTYTYTSAEGLAAWYQHTGAQFETGELAGMRATETGSMQAVGYDTILLTSGTTWVVPDNWDSTDNVVEVIGGGAGGITPVTGGGGGGGGGAYSAITNLSLTPGGSATYGVGVGGSPGQSGGDTWFNADNYNACESAGLTACVGAKGGNAGSTATGGVGGSQVSGIGSVRNSGGTGGNSAAGNTSGGGGGGAAAGPHGNGGSGGAGVANTFGGGAGGGGGADGGGNGSSAVSSVSGSGGLNRDGNGGGVNGAGGSGGGPGNPGSNENIWLETNTLITGGPGGGGGGGRGHGSAAGSHGWDGGSGASSAYGTGGGGGGGQGTSGIVGIAGSGRPGLIAISYAVESSLMSAPVKFDFVPGALFWDRFDWNASGVNGSMSVQLYHTVSETCDTLVPNGALPGNAAGFTEGPVSISGLDPQTYDEVCLYASFVYDDGSPTLESWTITSTVAPFPIVATENVSDVASSTATLHADLIGTGNETGAGTEHGFAYGTSTTLAGPNVATTTLGAYSGPGAFDQTLTSLTPGTTYYFRAYASNSSGTAFGGILSFLTTLPDAPVLLSSDGANQIAFNNIQYNSATPLFRVSADASGPLTAFQLELNTVADFSGTAYTQTFPGSFEPEVPYNLLASSLSPSLPTTDNFTYYTRIRGSEDGGQTWGPWSLGTWSYTYSVSASNPQWHQSTDAQFETGTLVAGAEINDGVGLAGDAAEPTYYFGGADSSGQTNAGTQSTAFGFNSFGTSMAVQGNYAYVMMQASSASCSQTAGETNGCELKVFDVSDPANPLYVGGGDASGATNSGVGAEIGTSVFVSGSYAYTTWDSDATECSHSPGSAVGCEFKIWDISDPAQPTYVGGGDVSGSTNSGTGGAAATSVFVSGNYAYMTSFFTFTTCSQTPGSALGCALKVWDISTPSTPTYVGGGTAEGLTNSNPTNFADTLRPTNIFVSGNYAYTTWVGHSSQTCFSSAGSATGCEFKIWDISNPAAPTFAAGRDAAGNTNGNSGISATSVFVSGNYAYTTWGASASACSQSAGSASGCELKVWDITTPTSPTYAAGRDSSGDSSGTGSVGSNGIFISGSDVYTTWNGSTGTCSQTAGSAVGCELKIWDISTPTAPVYANGIDASGTANSGGSSLAALGIFVSDVLVYTTWDGNSTACSATAGSAIGCELKIFGPTFGSITSSRIDFNLVPSTSLWNAAHIGGVGGNISVEVLGADQEPLGGYGCVMSAGACSVDLSTLDPVGTVNHASIYLRATLEYSGGFPTLEDWTVTWNNDASLVVETKPASNFTSSSAQLNGEILSTGGETGEGTEHGFAWGTNANLSGGDTATTTLGAYAGVGAFSESVSSLSRNTIYYFRAYASSSQELSYGDILSFTIATSRYSGGATIGGPPPEGQGTQGGGGSSSNEQIGNEPGFFAPESVGTASGWGTSWSGGQNAYTQDTSYASLNEQGASDYYDFNFSIPSGNQVTGIAVRLLGSATQAGGTIAAELSWDGGASVTGANLETGTLTTNDVVYTLGNISSLWGRSWSSTEFSNSNFRLRLIGNPSSNTVRLDAIQVRVYHQSSGGGSGGGADI